MRRNRRSSGKKERIVMIASSVFVLAALTMTGVYMQSRESESKDDGYTIDFAALESNAEKKNQEIAQNKQTEQIAQLPAEKDEQPQQAKGEPVIEGELDYMPLEAGSGLVEIPGLTDGVLGQTDVNVGLDGGAMAGITDGAQDSLLAEQSEAVAEADTAQKDTKAASANKAVVVKELHFAETDGLQRPLQGEVLIPFSMESGTYFATLEQYKYNPALMLKAEQGTPVTACAEGEVIEVFEDAEIGHAVTVNLGDGYQLTYGQLTEIAVSVGSHVKAGDAIGVVAAPTKYFSVEGANLYLKLMAGDVPVDPEKLFR